MNRRDSNRSRGIQSIEIGCRILRALESATGPMALKDIAAAAKMPPSKVRFYMVSFLRESILAQDPATSHYSLGPFSIQLGLAALRQSDLVVVARETMLGLRDKTGLSVFLSIWGNRGPTVVSKFEGRGHSPLSVRVGFGLPLTSSPTGNIFYTHLSARETDPILKLEQSGFVWTGARAASADALSKIANQVRERGYATSENVLHEGFTAAAAPIFDSTPELAGALTILGSNSAFEPAARKQKIIRMLTDSTGEISKQIGHRSKTTEKGT